MKKINGREALTERELEIKRQTESGLSKGKIAVLLGISKGTVGAHQRRIRQKLEGPERADSVYKRSESRLLRQVRKENRRLQYDIAFRERVEKELRKLNRAVEQSPCAIALADIGGAIEYVNPKFTELTGVSSEEAVGKPLDEIEIISAIAKIGRRKGWLEVKELHEEYQGKKRDGGTFWASSTISPIRDDSGTMTHLVLTSEDISERKRAEEERKEGEERYRQLVELCPETILVIIKGRITYINSSGVRMLGAVTPEQFIAKPIEDIFHPTSHKTIKNRMRQLTKYGVEAPLMEAKMVRLDGSEVDVECTGMPFIYEGKQAVLSFFRNITERKRNEHALRTTEKLAAAGRMAAQIAHEINNPLAGIKNSFLLLKDAVPSEHPYAVYLTRIETEIDRISDIVRQTMDLYRPDRRASPDCHIQESIVDVVALLETVTRSNEVAITCSFHSDDVFVKSIRESAFRQVMYNLIENAIEASPKEGAITISTEESEGFVEVSIADQGPGIAEELGSKIFESFFTTKIATPNGGLGLGLSISKSLIESAGGKLEFSSNPGKGTTFRLSLPRESPRKELKR